MVEKMAPRKHQTISDTAFATIRNASVGRAAAADAFEHVAQIRRHRSGHVDGALRQLAIKGADDQIERNRDHDRDDRAEEAREQADQRAVARRRSASTDSAGTHTRRRRRR